MYDEDDYYSGECDEFDDYAEDYGCEYDDCIGEDYETGGDYAERELSQGDGEHYDGDGHGGDSGHGTFSWFLFGGLVGLLSNDMLQGAREKSVTKSRGRAKQSVGRASAKHKAAEQPGNAGCFVAFAVALVIVILLFAIGVG